MQPWRLTRYVEQCLTEIAEWTAKRFGRKQALIWSGCPHRPAARSCEVLIQSQPAARGPLYCHEGSHDIILREAEERDVLDFLHERLDLPRHITNLEGLVGSPPCIVPAS